MKTTTNEREVAREDTRMLRAGTSRTAPSMSADSLARAKQHQAEERQRVFQATGVLISDDVGAYTIICPRCLYPATGDNEGLATRALSRHIVNDHQREGVRA